MWKREPLPPFEVGRQLAATHRANAAVMSLAYLLDGRQLAVALEDGTVELRHAETGVLVRTLLPATGVAGVVAASPDGKRVAFSAADAAIQLWDLERNIFLGELPGHLDAIVALAFSPDGRLLASASRDQSAVLWDVECRQVAGRSRQAGQRTDRAGVLARWRTAGGRRQRRWHPLLGPRQPARHRLRADPRRADHGTGLFTGRQALRGRRRAGLPQSVGRQRPARRPAAGRIARHRARADLQPRRQMAAGRRLGCGAAAVERRAGRTGAALRRRQPADLRAGPGPRGQADRRRRDRCAADDLALARSCRVAR
ncbi:MAG: hypothetical protein MZU91_01195 [Desulfosudis oleivorans]|nr:hypothetical protein [Desulfosudis oleivorans]